MRARTRYLEQLWSPRYSPQRSDMAGGSKHIQTVQTGGNRPVDHRNMNGKGLPGRSTYQGESKGSRLGPTAHVIAVSTAKGDPTFALRSESHLKKIKTAELDAWKHQQKCFFFFSSGLFKHMWHSLRPKHEIVCRCLLMPSGCNDYACCCIRGSFLPVARELCVPFDHV